MRFRFLSLSFSLLLIAALAGCQRREPEPPSPELAGLAQGIAREFRAVAPTVEVKDSTLAISFDDVRLHGLSAEESASMAERVAEYARDHYPRYPELRSVRVEFENARSWGPFKFEAISSHEMPATPRPARVDTLY